MLTLSDVSKSYGGVAAVAGLSLSIEPQRTTVLIGPSGCGKSTLLRMMNGLVEPDAGEVAWSGQTLTHQNLPAIRHRQGYVIQEGGLFPHLTAGDNLALLPEHLGWDKPRIRMRTTELAQLTRLDERLLDQYPQQLSGGQRQRVSLMRALMIDPEVLLLDEPLGALDPMIRADLQTDLRSIFETLNKTVILVTHDLKEADYFSDLIVLMRQGTIVQTGAMSDLMATPADPFVGRFIDAQQNRWGRA